jgi:L-ascorbate metabolism protein UlaG (beta-lactamase superfamily)
VSNEATLTYLGGPAFILETAEGRRILIDPYLDDEVGSPISSAELPDFDLLLLTHGGRTHVGDSLALLRDRPEVKLMCGPEVKYWAEDSGIPAERIEFTVWGVVRESCGVSIRCVEAHHISQMRTPGNTFLSGLGHGYILELPDGTSVYHLGDTSIFSDMKLIGELYQPTIGLVPVGAGTKVFFAELDAKEAALASSWIGFNSVVPMHYMPGSREREEFATALSTKAPEMRLAQMEPGDKVAIAELAKGVAEAAL